MKYIALLSLRLVQAVLISINQQHVFHRSISRLAGPGLRVSRSVSAASESIGASNITLLSLVGMRNRQINTEGERISVVFVRRCGLVEAVPEIELLVRIRQRQNVIRPSTVVRSRTSGSGVASKPSSW